MTILPTTKPPVRARTGDSLQELARNSQESRPETWQKAMKSAIRSPAELCRMLDLPQDLANRAAAEDFPVFVPEGYLSRIERGNPADPLLRQVLPVTDECESPAEYSTDPVGDHSATLRPGLLHKYHGRSLIVTTGACAIHCRYCFRRHFPYGEVPKSPAAWKSSVEAIAGDPTIEEVLLSGGDPLTLPDVHLQELAQQLANIPHVQRLRIHTRLPIMIPERVTDELIQLLTETRLTPVFVIHANHAQEIDEAVACSLGRLTAAGIPLLNQSVLLRGVNDDLESLATLCTRLVNLKVMPYYLHQLDRVAGAAHFEVPIAVGKQLMEELRARLPGYAVPRYVQEIPGEANKVVLA